MKPVVCRMCGKRLGHVHHDLPLDWRQTICARCLPIYWADTEGDLAVREACLDPRFLDIVVAAVKRYAPELRRRLEAAALPPKESP